MKTKIPSPILHALFGLIIGTALAGLSKLHIVNDYYYSALSLFGILFLLAKIYTQRWISVLVSSLILACIASVPIYFWQNTAMNSYSLATMFIAVLSAYAINVFHIAYYANEKWLNYDGLFYAVWDTFIDLFIATIFLVVGWLLIYLCDGLFSIIDINIDFILNDSWFIYIITSLLFSIGLYISLSAKNIVRNIREISLLLCKYLLAILAVISLIFLVAWAIKLQSLSEISTATQTVFITVSILSIIFVNGVFQNGEIKQPYPKILQILATIFIITTPIYSFIALYSFLNKSGFIFSGHLATLVNYGLLIIYNLSYAINAIIFRKNWLIGLKKTNIVLAFILIIIAFATNNSWFNSL